MQDGAEPILTHPHPRRSRVARFISALFRPPSEPISNKRPREASDEGSHNHGNEIADQVAEEAPDRSPHHHTPHQPKHDVLIAAFWHRRSAGVLAVQPAVNGFLFKIFSPLRGLPPEPAAITLSQTTQFGSSPCETAREKSLFTGLE